MQCDDVVDGEGGKETAFMIDVLAQAKNVDLCCVRLVMTTHLPWN